MLSRDFLSQNKGSAASLCGTLPFSEGMGEIFIMLFKHSKSNLANH